MPHFGEIKTWESLLDYSFKNDCTEYMKIHSRELNRYSPVCVSRVNLLEITFFSAL